MAGLVELGSESLYPARPWPQNFNPPFLFAVSKVDSDNILKNPRLAAVYLNLLKI
jgi:hypothetical protein